MEGLKINEINFEDHINKCRICFKAFAADEHWIDINKTIEKKFHQFTQTNLKMTTQFSRRICVVCNFQLTSFYHAKINIINAQKALAKFITTSAKSPKSAAKSPAKHEILSQMENVPEVTEIAHEEEVIEEHLIEDENFHEISYQIIEGSQIKCNLSGYTASNRTDTKCHENGTAKTPPRQSQRPTKWKCHECNKSFSGGSSLTNHISIYHSTSTFAIECPVADCEKKCKTKKQLTQHLKTHNEDKQICPECGLVVGNKHNLTKHIRRIHLKIYNFYCDLCDYKGFFKFNIDQHVNHIQKTIQFYSMKKHLDKSSRERFYCDVCHFESISKMSLRTHKRMEHMGQKRSYTCHCGKAFTQSSSYYTHVKVVHQKIKNHACPYSECSKLFSEKSQLKNHIKSQHLKKRDVPCNECGKLFSTQKHLAAHLKYHKPPSFICQYENCNNSFYTSTQLASHYKVHNNQRDFGCQYCDKKYFHRSHLKKHLLTHSS